MRYRILDTPTGLFALRERDAGDARDGLATGWVTGPDDDALAGGTPDDRMHADLAARLERYFAGLETDFDDVPLPGPAHPEFFRRCWKACRSIPRGETRTYGELAVMAGGGPASARAAGQSMRRNPLPIIVPCHRVLGANDRLVGFGGSTDAAGVPLATKRWLLAMEGARCAATEPTLFPA
jgi:methylated-DNA-[protein]-cysteine S-methyltransferase